MAKHFRCHAIKHSLLQLKVLLILPFSFFVSGFNIETDYCVVHRGAANSKFGFSVAQHRDVNGYWVLVGAPEAETGVPGVLKGGAVYKCHSLIQNHCEIVPFDDKGNLHDGTQYMDDKSRQWFGASVISRSGVAAACAPRYVWFSVKKNRREPIGNCYILTNGRGPDRFKTYSPCMNSAWGYHRQGTCQAGFGVALSKGGNKIYVGAVGSWYWQGQIFYQSLLNMQEKISTQEAPKDFDMSYMGFSLCMGHFNGDGEEDLAAGVPKGAGLKGMVAILNHKLEGIYNLTGTQMGSYFGYSVACLDFDGDGLDDVAVGAPWYSSASKSSGMFEEGAVVLFKHTKQHNFKRILRISGVRSRAHFGLSLAALNDLNGDGFEDLAVGAPRDGENSRGAVYIFLGSEQGIREKPMQIIYAENLLDIATSTTFGWSLSGGLDLDENGYPDLAVGAHESDLVFIFRTRPVISVNASVKIESESGVFDLESLVCSLQDNTAVACYPVHYCLSYTGKGVPPEVEVFFTLRVDVSPVDSPRIFFLKNERHSVLDGSVQLRKNVVRCTSQYIYAAPMIHDKLTPIITELEFSLNGSSEAPDESELRPVLIPPLLGQTNLVQHRIFIQNDCGSDNICIPDLKGRFASKSMNYTLGSEEDLVLDVRILNQGEDAYRSRVFLKVPDGVNFGKFFVTYNGSPDDVTPFCTTVPRVTESSSKNELYSKINGNFGYERKLKRETYFHEIICEVGNPLPSGSAVGLRLHFQPHPKLIHYSNLRFDFKVNSTNPETNLTIEDNFHSILLPVVMVSEVSIRGISWPDADFNYNASLFGQKLLGADKSIQSEDEAGPEVTHIYHVVNRGPSDLPRVEIFLLWPTRTLVGDPLLYLPEEPIVLPENIACDPPSAVNYLGLAVNSPSYESALIQEPPSPFGPFELPSTLKSLRLGRWNRDIQSKDIFFQLFDTENSTSSFVERGRDELEELLSCGPTNCSVMRCFLPVFKSSDNLIVKVRSRLWVDTIEKLGLANLKISSRLVVFSTGNFHPTSGRSLSWYESVTSVIKSPQTTPVFSLSWMVWVGSALVGFIVLALLIFLLWMMGFFKRRRPTASNRERS